MDGKNLSHLKSVRIASPSRHQVKHFTPSGNDGYVKVSILREPQYYNNFANQMKGLNLGSSSSRVSCNNAFIFPKTFMFKNADRMNLQVLNDFRAHTRVSNMDSQWCQGKTLTNSQSSSSGPTAADLVNLWLEEKSAKTIKKQRELLPIFKSRNDFIRAVAENQFVIVQGETGSGKSTQIPQYLLEAGCFGQKIVCTQPRRIAAKNLAIRVAEEQGVAVGSEVGYKYRCCDVTSNSTLIKYCTDGTLTRECLNANLLDSYSVIILDEAHERKIDTDVLLGYLKREAGKRPKLKVIVSSATMDAEKFSRFFFNAPIFVIQGRTFPVEIFYRSINVEDYFNAALGTVAYIDRTQKPGDILLFLTGRDEIERACEVLNANANLEVLPMYSTLEMNEQEKVFQPAPPLKRKVVISTNLAETSMTIPGIYYVIDTGYTKTKMYDPKSGVESLIILPTSHASADQRAGRAGRTAPGKCFRLFTESNFREMFPTVTPEIQRSNLSLIVLQFKAFGIQDIGNFEFMDQPSKDILEMSEKQLFRLGALDDAGFITELGKRMVKYPLEPYLSKMLIASIDLQCSDEIITIISMMGLQNIFRRPKKMRHEADQRKSRFKSDVSDLITYMNVYMTWERNDCSSDWCFENFINESGLKEACEIRAMLIDKMHQNKEEIVSCGKNFERVQMAICAGLALNVARTKVIKKNYNVYDYDDFDPYDVLYEYAPSPINCEYVTIQDQPKTVFLHPSSGMHSLEANRWFVYHKLMKDKSNDKMRDVTLINPKWLNNLASSVYVVQQL